MTSESSILAITWCTVMADTINISPQVVIELCHQCSHKTDQMSAQLTVNLLHILSYLLPPSVMSEIHNAANAGICSEAAIVLASSVH